MLSSQRWQSGQLGRCHLSLGRYGCFYKRIDVKLGKLRHFGIRRFRVMEQPRGEAGQVGHHGSSDGSLQWTVRVSLVPLPCSRRDSSWRTACKRHLLARSSLQYLNKLGRGISHAKTMLYSICHLRLGTEVAPMKHYACVSRMSLHWYVPSLA